jgi:hypothetical protein
MNKSISKLPQSDPKLKEAAAEIDAICEKYGIAAFYALASSTHAEFKLQFPEWSLVQMEPHGKGVRLQAKSTERELSTASIHLVYSLRDIAGLMFQNLEAIAQVIDEKLGVQHQPFDNLWELDGWQKPDLPVAPAEVIDLKKRKQGKRNKPKGFRP